MKTSTEPAVTVQFATATDGLPGQADFRAWAAAALGDERPDAELCIRVVDEVEGLELNRVYRGRGYATNVLAFPADLPPGVDTPLLGDLAVCAPVVLDEAREQGKAAAAHFAHMTVHGVLHLLGHDHQASAAAAVMEARETAILAGLGFPDPYRDSRIEAGQRRGDFRTPS